jgi:hypothetical protein
MFKCHGLLIGTLSVLALVSAGCTDTRNVIGDLPYGSISDRQGASPAAPSTPSRPRSTASYAQSGGNGAPSVNYRRTSYDYDRPYSSWAPSAYDRPWRYIVIHHSDTQVGSAEIFDAAHRARGWDELGYHFVIDNGRGGGNGQVEVGSRWTKQKWGAHTGNTPGNDYNNYGIGICLVGDFSGHLPSQAQLASLRKLVLYLSDRYHIDASHVIGHRDAPNADTQCPGDSLYRYVYSDLRPAVSAHRRGQ